MHWNFTSELAEQHRHELLRAATAARLARESRPGRGLIHRLLAGVTRDQAPDPVATVSTLPRPTERSAAA